MKKEQKQVEHHDIDDFENHCHLWNIVPGGQGRGIEFLRAIADSIQNTNYSHPGNRLPSLLIAGQGKELVSKAFVNSLHSEDIRGCKARYFEQGIYSYQFFNESLFHTVHIIEDVDQLKGAYESVLWRYIEQEFCQYYKYGNREADFILHCNGMIILTAKDIKSVPEPIVKAVDHTIQLEPYTREQYLLIAHQYLKFCGIEYEGEAVLQEIVGPAPLGIRVVIKTLKTCMVLLKAQMEECLTVQIVKKAKRLFALPLAHPDSDIPF